MENGNQKIPLGGYASNSDLKRNERALFDQQKEIKEIAKALVDVSSQQQEMKSTFDHFSSDLDFFRKDVQRIFDKRSEDLASAKPNYFAWVIGGVTILGSSMAFVFTFVSLVLAPMQKDDAKLEKSIAALVLQTQSHQEAANIRIQSGNQYMGKQEAETIELRKDVDWLFDEVVSMVRSRHTSENERSNQELNRYERERIKTELRNQGK